MTPKPLSAAESRAATRASVRVAAWGVAIYFGTRIFGLVLEKNTLPVAVVQAVLAEWGCGRLGVAWSDPSAPLPEPRAIAKRAGIGLGFGLLAGGVVVAFLLTTRAILLDRVAPTWQGVSLALFGAGAYALRDELILHGLALRVLVSVESPIAKVLACGLTSAAAAYGEFGGAAGSAIVVQGLLGIIFGALWVRDRGAWPAWGAHAAWLFITDFLMRGGIFEAHNLGTAWGGAEWGPLGGQAAVVALLPLAIGALVGARPAPARVTAAPEPPSDDPA